MTEVLEAIDDQDEATTDHGDLEVDGEEAARGQELYESIDDLDDEAEF